MNLEENYQRVKNLLLSTEREGVEDLVAWLDTTDFKVAPASCNYHQNWEGGLCEHCLNVYDNMVQIVQTFDKDQKYNEDSVILTALLHDISKTNFYEKYDKNVKVDGQWVQETHYKTKGQRDKFVFGTHEQNSLFIASQFVKLSIEEQVAINCHHGGMGENNTPLSVISDVYVNYKLPMYLHIADLLDAFNEQRN